ncbi:helix-turn-helix domain-containing protein [Terriglobus sp. TAA 43]|uniref:helix-turn-helix domain-containing protein n=1 Tax=Terriglobus sp. TAA 43 TaxID=278961 RepID=UPI0035106F14
MPALPLWLPLPSSETLSLVCRQFLLNPTSASHIKGWADALDTSRRTFTRNFRKETNLSFAEWRQRACILAALPKLAAGASVTETALCLGYENPASFTTLFKRVLGVPPKKYATSIIQNQPRR